MSESIGSLYPTKIASLSETADIQEAFRLYHYGAASGTGVGEYDPTNSDVENLINPSIAYTLNSLQSQISTISGSLGVQASVWTTKGDIVTATGSALVARLGVGSDGTVLTANSGSSTGLSWSAPVVTLTNTISLSNKTIALGSNTVSGTTSQFNTALTDNDFATLAGTETFTNKTLTAPIVSQLYLSDSVVVFEGSTADSYETTLTAVDPTADRTISLPNVDGTVITTGNLTDISSINASGNVIYHIATNAQSSSYSLLTADDGKIVEMSGGGTLTVPADGGTFVVPVGTQITIIQTGSSQVTIAGSGSTVNATPGLKLRAQWSSATLIKRSANTWIAIGDLVA